MSRQNKLQSGPFRPHWHRPRLSAENHRLTAGCDVGEPQSCQRLKFPGFDRMQGPPLGGLLLFWAGVLQKLTISR